MKRTYIPVNNKFSSEKIFYDEIVLLEKEINNINIITAKGMGSAVNFGLEIVKKFRSDDFVDKLKSSLQCSI